LPEHPSLPHTHTLSLPPPTLNKQTNKQTNKQLLYLPLTPIRSALRNTRDKARMLGACLTDLRLTRAYAITTALRSVPNLGRMRNRLARFDLMQEAVQQLIITDSPGIDDAVLSFRMPPDDGMLRWCEDGSDESKLVEGLLLHSQNHSFLASCTMAAAVADDDGEGDAGRQACRVDARVIGGRPRAMLGLLRFVSDSVEWDGGRHVDDAYMQAYDRQFPGRFKKLAVPRPSGREAASLFETDIDSSKGVLTVTGYPGRLGNWMFRVASAMAMALDNRRQLVLEASLPCITGEEQSQGDVDTGGGSGDDGQDAKHDDEDHPHCTFHSSFFHWVPRIPDLSEMVQSAVVQEQHFGYSQTVPSMVSSVPRENSVVLFGFFQSFLFFDHRREEVMSALRLPQRYERDAISRLAWLSRGIPVSRARLTP